MKPENRKEIRPIESYENCRSEHSRVERDFKKIFPLEGLLPSIKRVSPAEAVKLSEDVGKNIEAAEKTKGKLADALKVANQKRSKETRSNPVCRQLASQIKAMDKIISRERFIKDKVDQYIPEKNDQKFEAAKTTQEKLREKVSPSRQRKAIEGLKKCQEGCAVEKKQNSKEIETLSERLKSIAVEKMQNQKELDAVNKKLEAGKQEAKSIDKELEAIHKEAKKLPEDKKGETEKASLDARKEKLEDRKEELQAQNEKLEARKEELQAQKEKLNTSDEKLESRKKKLENRNKVLDERQEQLDAYKTEAYKLMGKAFQKGDLSRNKKRKLSGALADMEGHKKELERKKAAEAAKVTEKPTQDTKEAAQETKETAKETKETAQDTREAAKEVQLPTKEEQIGDMEKAIAEVREASYADAKAESEERSAAEKDLKKDKACIENNIRVKSDLLRQLDQLDDAGNTDGRAQENKGEQRTEENNEKTETSLPDRREQLQSKIETLDKHNKELSERHGTNAYGREILPIARTEQQEEAIVKEIAKCNTAEVGQKAQCDLTPGELKAAVEEGDQGVEGWRTVRGAMVSCVANEAITAERLEKLKEIESGLEAAGKEKEARAVHNLCDPQRTVALRMKNGMPEFSLEKADPEKAFLENAGENAKLNEAYETTMAKFEGHEQDKVARLENKGKGRTELERAQHNTLLHEQPAVEKEVNKRLEDLNARKDQIKAEMTQLEKDGEEDSDRYKSLKAESKYREKQTERLESARDQFLIEMALKDCGYDPESAQTPRDLQSKETQKEMGRKYGRKNEGSLMRTERMLESGIAACDRRIAAEKNEALKAEIEQQKKDLQRNLYYTKIFLAQKAWKQYESRYEKLQADKKPQKPEEEREKNKLAAFFRLPPALEKQYIKNALTRYEEARALAEKIAPETKKENRQLSIEDTRKQRKLEELYAAMPDGKLQAHSEASDENTIKRASKLSEKGMRGAAMINAMNKKNLFKAVAVHLEGWIKAYEERPEYEYDKQERKVIRRLKAGKCVAELASAVWETGKAFLKKSRPEATKTAGDEVTDAVLTIVEKVLVEEKDEAGKAAWDAIKETVRADWPLSQIPVCVLKLGGLLLTDRYGSDYSMNGRMTAADMKLYILFNPTAVEAADLISGVAEGAYDAVKEE